MAKYPLVLDEDDDGDEDYKPESEDDEEDQEQEDVAGLQPSTKKKQKPRQPNITFDDRVEAKLIIWYWDHPNSTTVN